MLDRFFFVDQNDPSPEMKDYPEHSGPSQSRGSIITINSIVNPQKIVAFVAHHSSWFIIIDHTFNYLCLVGFWYDCKSLLDTISTYITLYISVIYDSVFSRIWHKILFNK